MVLGQRRRPPRAQATGLAHPDKRGVALLRPGDPLAARRLRRDRRGHLAPLNQDKTLQAPTAARLVIFNTFYLLLLGSKPKSLVVGCDRGLPGLRGHAKYQAPHETEANVVYGISPLSLKGQLQTAFV